MKQACAFGDLYPQFLSVTEKTVAVDQHISLPVTVAAV